MQCLRLSFAQTSSLSYISCFATSPSASQAPNIAKLVLLSSMSCIQLATTAYQLFL